MKDNKTLEKEIRDIYKGILSEEIIQATIMWWNDKIAVAKIEYIEKKDQEIKSIIEEMIGSDDCLEWNTNSEEVNGYSAKRNEIIEIAKKHNLTNKEY